MIVITVCAILTTFGFIFSLLFLVIISSLLCVYCIILCSWLYFKELPDYEQKKTKYDDVWFEGQATELGDLANKDKWSWL
jgi:anaerobic C4-dicarboxylate transporter